MGFCGLSVGLRWFCTDVTEVLDPSPQFSSRNGIPIQKISKEYLYWGDFYVNFNVSEHRAAISYCLFVLEGLGSLPVLDVESRVVL